MTRGSLSKLRLTTLVLTALALAACVHHVPSPVAADAPRPYAVTWSGPWVYTPDDWPKALSGDVVRPDDGKTYPGVLMVHGGGWERGERDDMRELAEEVARAGFVVFNISHRFAPESVFPAQIHDLQHAVRWMRHHATDHGINAKRIAAWGYSSGAHLTTLLAAIDTDNPLDAPHGGPDTRLQAVVGGGTPADLRKFGGGRLVVQFMQGQRDARPDAYALASPVTHVDGDHPPTFLYHGALDWVVGADHAREYFEALQAAGVPSELLVHRLRGHIAMFVWDDAAVEAGTTFLVRHLR